MTISDRGRSARTMRPTARFTLAAALCVLVLPANSGWVQQTHLFADDAAAGDRFGKSVAIDGDTIVSTGGGSAYAFTRTGSTWSQQDQLPSGSGSSVAIDGDTIVVGAWADYTAAGPYAGSAYVFTRTGSTWSQQDHLFADDAEAGDYFGSSVAIDGDTIVVGAYPDDGPIWSDPGSAYVFTRTGSTWSQQDHLFVDDAVAYGYWFGYSVAIDGDTIVVGAIWADSASGSPVTGSAYVYTRIGGTWSLQKQLSADDAATDDLFGSSVAIDGDTIVMGAMGDETAAGDFAGSAYVFTRSESIWVPWVQQAHLFADDATAGDFFGESVAIDGNTLVVGSPQINTAGDNTGSAYVFTRRGGTWSQYAQQFADDAAAGDRFGESVALDGDTLIVGAFNDDTAAGDNAGSAYVFGPASFRIFVGEPELPSDH